MNVLEIMKTDLNSIIGSVVEYDFGGSKPIIGKVMAARKNVYLIKADKFNPEDSVISVYTISFDGESFFTVDKLTKKIA